MRRIPMTLMAIQMVMVIRLSSSMTMMMMMMMMMMNMAMLVITFLKTNNEMPLLGARINDQLCRCII